jgi:hypothetical protein
VPVGEIVKAEQLREITGRLLTVAEAAERLAVSAKHFRQHLVNTGQIRVISLGKGCKGDRIAPQDIESLIASIGQVLAASNGKGWLQP